MSAGLLWFDDDPQRGLRQKVENAARRYREKFGRDPAVCYVHPAALGQAEAIFMDVNGFRLRVVPQRSILRYHLLLTEEPKEAK